MIAVSMMLPAPRRKHRGGRSNVDIRQCIRDERYCARSNLPTTRAAIRGAAIGGPPRHPDYCRLTSLRKSVQVYGIMVLLNGRNRRSRLGLPREYSRSLGGDDLFGNAAPGGRGGSGGDGGMEAWQRLCAVVS